MSWRVYSKDHSCLSRFPFMFETRGNTRNVCWVTYPETAIFKILKIFHLVTLVMKAREKGKTQATDNI